MQEVFSAQEERVQPVYGYDNPEFQELAEMQAFTQDESERQEMIARMQQILPRTCQSCRFSTRTSSTSSARGSSTPGTSRPEGSR